MTTRQALNNIHAPKGMTSILEGIAEGDFSVLPHSEGNGSNLQTAIQKVTEYDEKLHQCTSDAAYWSILSDLEYWKAVRNIFQAAEITGADNLPDIPAPDLNGMMVMDAIDRVRMYGIAVLEEAQKK